MAEHDRLAPTDVEVLANLLLGRDPGAEPLDPAPGRGARAALEAAARSALQHQPCCVSFSGGRDSSAILALATSVARREGLADPVPVTLRYPDAPETDEARWQELILAHLGVDEREVIEIRDELDAVGPVATAVLRRHGVRWPGNAYMHVPILERARGGSLLTGIGGDELLGTRAGRLVLVARRAAAPRPLDLARMLLALAPRSLRARIRQPRLAPPHPWLTRDGGARVDRAIAVDTVAWPERWDASLHHWCATRAFSAVRTALGRLGDDAGVRVVNPFVDATVLAELAVMGGATGFASRDDAMQRLFGDLLPAEVLTRRTKAGFSSPVWGRHARAFAQGWDGSGVDPRDVHGDALRREWLAPNPSFNTVLLLHAAWRANNP